MHTTHTLFLLRCYRQQQIVYSRRQLSWCTHERVRSCWLTISSQSLSKTKYPSRLMGISVDVHVNNEHSSFLVSSRVPEINFNFSLARSSHDINKLKFSLLPPRLARFTEEKCRTNERLKPNIEKTKTKRSRVASKPRFANILTPSLSSEFTQCRRLLLNSRTPLDLHRFLSSLMAAFLRNALMKHLFDDN